MISASFSILLRPPFSSLDKTTASLACVNRKQYRSLRVTGRAHLWFVARRVCVCGHPNGRTKSF